MWGLQESPVESDIEARWICTAGYAIYSVGSLLYGTAAMLCTAQGSIADEA